MTRAPVSGRFRQDAFWSSIGVVLPIALGAAAVPLLLNALGAGPFATIAIALAIHTFSPSLDFGISRVTLRRIAAARDVDQTQTQHVAEVGVVSGFYASLVITSVLSVVIVAITASEVDARGASLDRSALLVACLGVPFAILGNVQRAILEGMRLFAKAAAVRVLLGVATAVVPLLMLPFTRSLDAICGALVITRVLVVVHQAIVIRASGVDLPFFSLRSARMQREHPTGFWKESASYAVISWCSLAMSGFDRFIVATLGRFSPTELSLLLAPQDVALRAIVLPASVIPALLVRMASGVSVIQANAREIALRLHWLVFGVVLGASVCVIVLAEALSSAVFPSLDKASVRTIVIALVFGVFSNALAQIPMAGITAAGAPRSVAVSQLLQLVVFMAAMPFLLSRFGVVGGAIAWSARIVVDTIALGWLANKHAPGLAIPRFQLGHCIGLLALAVAVVVQQRVGA
jgi:O-antigen/teichoic acid export membrane protein